MASRNPAPTGDPNKIMGVSKPIFWGIVIIGVILAFYLVRKSGSSTAATTTSAVPAGGGDWAADDALAAQAEQSLASAGLPNLPGSNGNPNPGTTAAPPPTQEPVYPELPSGSPTISGSIYGGTIGSGSYTNTATIPVYGSPIPPAYNPVNAPIRSRFSGGGP
jgi:hypothetical protein